MVSAIPAFVPRLCLNVAYTRTSGSIPYRHKTAEKRQGAERTLSADERPWNCGVSCDVAATPTQAVTVKPLRRDTIFSPSRCSMANSFLAGTHSGFEPSSSRFNSALQSAMVVQCELRPDRPGWLCA